LSIAIDRLSSNARLKRALEHERHYIAVSIAYLAGLQHPDEIEAVAHRHGFKVDQPHICDVMDEVKSFANVVIETDALRWMSSFLPEEEAKTVSVSNEGLNVSGIPLGGIATHSAEILLSSRPLKLVFEQMPARATALVDILGRRNARALKVSVGAQTHYVFDYRNGFTAFIREV